MSDESEWPVGTWVRLLEDDGSTTHTVTLSQPFQVNGVRVVRVKKPFQYRGSRVARQSRMAVASHALEACTWLPAPGQPDPYRRDTLPGFTRWSEEMMK